MARSTAVAVPTEAEELNEKFAPLVKSNIAEDPSAVSVRIVKSILDRDSIDSILDAGDATALSAEDIGTRSFRILDDPTWLESKYEKSEAMLHYFAVLPIQMADTGKEEVVSVGGSNVLAQLYAAKEAGSATVEGRWMKFKRVPTASGNDVLWLQRGEGPEAPFNDSDKVKS